MTHTANKNAKRALRASTGLKGLASLCGFGLLLLGTGNEARAQQITCDGRVVESLNFSGGSLIDGSDLQPGAVYFYSNVTAGVDARFEVLSFQNGASLDEFDNDGGLFRNLQPEIIPNANGGGFVEFRVSFFQAGTTNPIALDVTATQIDVDGDNVTLREFVDFEDRFVEFTLNNPTLLDINASASSALDRQRFEASESDVATGIDPDAVENAVRAVYTNATSFEYALGTLDDGASTRLTSLSFDCPTFTNPVTTPNPNANLVTVKTLASGDSTPGEGDTVTFQIVVRNDGGGDATNVSLTDLIPSGLTATTGANANGTVSQGSYDGNSGVWTIGGLANGASATLIIQGTLDAGQLAETAIQNLTTAAAGDQNDPTTAGDDLEETVTVASNPELEMTKVADDDELVTVGQVITYTYTVTNTGNEFINNVTVNDAHNGAGPAPIPTDEDLFTDNGDQDDSTDATPDDGVWDVLAPGDVITFTGTYTVEQADIDNLQ